MSEQLPTAVSITDYRQSENCEAAIVCLNLTANEHNVGTIVLVTSALQLLN